MKKLALLIIAFLLSCLPSMAQDVGFFMRPDTTSGSIANPVTNQTVVFNQTTGQLEAYTSLGWVVISTSLNNFTATAAPTVSNDQTQGYSAGSLWLDTTHHLEYVCSSASTGAAVWLELNTPDTDKLTTADWFSDWIVTGIVGSVPVSGLTATTTAGTAYVTGLRTLVGLTNYAYTASKDTYDFLQTDGTWHHNAVGNGAGQPTDTGLLIQKVVSDATDVTSVTALAATLPTVHVPTASGSMPLPKTQADSLYVLDSVYGADGDLLVGTGTAGSPSILHKGSPSTLLGVPASGTGLQYWSFAAGGLITITPSGTTFTITDNLPAFGTAGNAMVDTGSAWGSSPIVNSAIAGEGINVSGPTGNVTFSHAVFPSTDQTITSAGLLTIPHGFSYAPKKVWAALVCQTGEANYTAGQVVEWGQIPAAANGGYSCVIDGTNLNIRFGSATNVFHLPDATTGVDTALTNGNWKVRFYAE